MAQVAGAAEEAAGAKGSADDTGAADVAGSAPLVAGADDGDTDPLLADPCTARPVTAPRPLTTQSRAALLIAALLEGLHW